MLEIEPSAMKILIVDDDIAVQSMMARALAKVGYRITKASCGEEALERYDTDGPFHLLLTDINLPGYNGRDLASEMRKRFPDLRVILCSGDHLQNSDVLLKPFSIAALRTRVLVELTSLPSGQLAD